MSAFSFDDTELVVTAAHDLDETVTEHLGVVVSDVTAGRHVGKDFLASLRNFFGGRSRSWENTLQDAQEQALRELVNEAQDRGADAVIGVELEDEVVGNGGMMNVKAVGAAVVLGE